MKQVLQRRGVFTVEDVPAPAVPDGFVLVRTAASLLSVGTERMIAQTGGASLMKKAAGKPELVAQVLGRVAQDGLRATIEGVQARLDDPVPVGYSAAGTVIASRVEGEALGAGTRVACAGAGFANHAELICVPKHLCAAIPDAVSFEEAAFATVGAIALHGVRLAKLEVGSTVAVIGMGLLGQLTAQICAASGCRVLAVDLAQDRVDLALALGAAAGAVPDTAASAAAALTAGLGVDAVLITADTSSHAPVELAGDIARDRAVVVAVGAVGLQIPRGTYYRKELQFLISRSYGPGRHDEAYEIGGHDYPAGYVRWTEQRNLASFLDLVASGRVRVAPLITHRFPQVDAPAAYDVITGKTPGRFLGVVLTYLDADAGPPAAAAAYTAPPAAARSGTVRLGLIGAGAFAKSVLLPAFKADGRVHFRGVVSRQGLSAKSAADRFGFDYAATDEARLLDDGDVDSVVIATRHNLHAPQALAAAARGKDVFVEKPLCLHEEELDALERAFSREGAPRLMVGFNRRFAPLAITMRGFFAGVGAPLVAHYRVNAGFIPPDHWVHNPAEGGGRIIGEACHFVDFLGWLFGARPVAVTSVAVSGGSSGADTGDSMIITLEYEGGSVGTITYVPSGDAAAGKERIEVHGGGRSAALDDYRELRLYHAKRERVTRHRLSQDKGHRAEVSAFIAAVLAGAPSPIGPRDLFTTTRATLRAVESARLRKTLAI